MKNKQATKETIEMVEVMIQHSDKGPSGFWVEDHEGCGNPQIFPEFAEGLKSGRLVFKEHYLCPWNKAVFYGEGNGDIHTGCYHSCSINDAKYLSSEMVKAVLCRFKKRLSSGQYEQLDHVRPLLTQDERVYIEKQKVKQQKQSELQCKKETAYKKKLAAPLLEKYQDNKDTTATILGSYGQNVMVQTEHGYLNFSPSGKVGIEGGESLTYNQYLDLQIQSLGKHRTGFELCYYGGGKFGAFRGEIQKISKGKVCFKRIYIQGMYSDGLFFENKEEHVWMDRMGFEEFCIGDCVEFYAEVYRYIKTGNGKCLDYALRNPEQIKKVEKYALPSDDALLKQDLDMMICETCPMSDYCIGFCVNQEWRKMMERDLFKAMKKTNDA